MPNKKNNTIDWNIHAVYTDKEHPEPIDMHTHGLEKHGIYNICMVCPSQDLIEFCGGFINHLAQTMIDGEKYDCGRTQLLDNADNYNEVYDVFDIETDKRDNGEGEETVYVIDYWFDKPFFSPYSGCIHTFNREKKKWEIE